VGQVIQYLFPNSTEKFFIDWKLNKLGSFSLLIIIWQTFDQAFASGAFASVKGSNLVFVVFINIAHFTVWLVISLAASVGWLSRKDTVAVAYCVPAKTPAMGVPLSNVLFVGLSRLETSKIQVCDNSEGGLAGCS
jgi:sodium/bile acid cotransporter 7